MSGTARGRPRIGSVLVRRCRPDHRVPAAARARVRDRAVDALGAEDRLPLAVVPDHLRAGRRAAQRRAPGADHVRLRAGIVDRQRPARSLVREAVLRAGVARGRDHRLPLQRHAREDLVLHAEEAGIARLDELLAVAPARRHHLGGVAARDPVEQVEGRGVVVVGRLVDDERRRGRVVRGELDVERGLPGSGGRPGRPAVDQHVGDRRREAVAGLEGVVVAGRVLLELDDGDRLPDPRASLPEQLVEAEDRRELRRRVGAGVLGGVGGRTAARLRRRQVRHGVPLTRLWRGGAGARGCVRAGAARASSAAGTGRRGRPRPSPGRRGRRGSVAKPC